MTLFPYIPDFDDIVTFIRRLVNSQKVPWKSRMEASRHIAWNLGLIALGSALCSVAINGILLPQRFYGAGFTGVALIIHYHYRPGNNRTISIGWRDYER